MAVPPDSVPVTMWRTAFCLNLSPGRKADIDATVDDLELWGRVIEYAKRRKWNKFKVQWLLSQYDEWERDE